MRLNLSRKIKKHVMNRPNKMRLATNDDTIADVDVPAAEGVAMTLALRYSYRRSKLNRSMF